MKITIILFLFTAFLGVQGCSIIKKDCDCPRFNQNIEAPANPSAEEVQV